MKECVFCQIIEHKTRTQIEYEDTEVIAFPDIAPKVPIHLLICSRKHIPSIAQLSPDDERLIGKIIFIAKMLAEKKGLKEEGYRLVFNVGKNAGQVIEHLHLHLLGGKPLGPLV